MDTQALRHRLAIRIAGRSLTRVEPHVLASLRSTGRVVRVERGLDRLPSVSARRTAIVRAKEAGSKR